MKTNAAGRELIKRFEGLRLKAYLCPAGKWSIGYGHTGDVAEGQAITEHQAEAILDVDLERFERGVGRVLDWPATENQFSALVSLAFNIGLPAFSNSTLLDKLNAGCGAREVADQFGRWVRGGGHTLQGLVSRRAAEAELFLKE